MTKHLILLVCGSLFFAIGLTDVVAKTSLSRYIVLPAGLALGALAVYRIQKQKSE